MAKPDPLVVEDLLLEAGYTKEQARRMIACVDAPKVLTLRSRVDYAALLQAGPEGRVGLLANNRVRAAKAFGTELMEKGWIAHHEQRATDADATEHIFSIALA